MREMKDSGVEWMGKVPENWNIVALKFLCSMQSGKTLSSEQISEEGKYPVYGGNGLRGYYSEANTFGDYLLVGRQGALCGNVHHVQGEFWATEHAVVTKCSALSDVRYMYYLLLGMNLNQYASNTAAQPGLAVSQIINVKTCLAPIQEQKLIAVVLDEKCAQVNTLIANVQAQIEKLKAYKQSLITEVVTKGLDHTVPMKDSGVAWIGEIPAHWEITRKLAFVTTEGISYGIVKLFDPDDVSGVKVLRCSDVLEGWIKPDNIRTVMREVSNEYARTILSGGEVVVNVRGSLGGCAVVPKTMAGYNIAREVAKIALNDSMCNRYVMYYLLSRCFVEYRTSRLSGSVYVGLNIELLSSCPLPNPDLEEQTAIADYLDEKCSQIDRLIAIKQAKIEKLEQYKRSLIYEYVTGKREVV